MVILKLVALFLVVMTVIPSVAHALELPGKLRLSEDQYLAIQPIYYPGFTVAGGAEPLAIVALAILLALTPPMGPAFWLTALSLLAEILMHLLYWILTAPVNKIWLQNEALSSGARRFFQMDGTRPEAQWTWLRNRWERSHLYRAAAALTAFVLLAVAFLGSG